MSNGPGRATPRNVTAVRAVRAVRGGEGGPKPFSRAGALQFFAPCPRGLEALLAEDLTAWGAENVRPVPGGAEFSGTWRLCYRVNLESRIATRVLWRVGGGQAASEQDLYRIAYDIEWPRLFSVERSIRVFVTAQKAPFKSLEFITLKAKDAVCDRFRSGLGRRPNVDTRSPDVRIHLFQTGSEAVFYVDTSGEPLWQRGFKLAKVEAPLKENLAAGLLRLAGWQPGQPLLDPMCGSGTFLLEAVGMALDDAPGLNREPGAFGFERLSVFQPEIWRELQREVAGRRQDAARLPIWGSDLSADAVARTQQNLAYAGYDELVNVGQSDVLNCEKPAAEGLLIANPPYGERLGEKAELAAFYPRLGDALKAHFSGWYCWLLSADTELPKLIRLKADRRIPVYNGPLECRLYGFTMVAGQNR